MKNTEKAKRIIQTIRETEKLLEKAKKNYQDTITVLKMEIAENGSRKELNKPWVEYALQDKKVVDNYKAHIERLQNMLAALA